MSSMQEALLSQAGALAKKGLAYRDVMKMTARIETEIEARRLRLHNRSMASKEEAEVSLTEEQERITHQLEMSHGPIWEAMRNPEYTYLQAQQVLSMWAGSDPSSDTSYALAELFINLVTLERALEPCETQDEKIAVVEEHEFPDFQDFFKGEFWKFLDFTR